MTCLCSGIALGLEPIVSSANHTVSKLVLLAACPHLHGPLKIINHKSNQFAVPGDDTCIVYNVADQTAQKTMPPAV